MEGPRVILFLVVLFLFFASPNTRPLSLAQQHGLDHTIAEERYSVSLLNVSTRGTFDPPTDRWLNITGFRRNDGYAWNILSLVRSRAREQRRRIFYAWPEAFQSPDGATVVKSSNESEIATNTMFASTALHGYNENVYENVTGFIRGKWVRWEPPVSYQRPKLNLTTLAPSMFHTKGIFGRNVTGREGDLRFKLDEKGSESVSSNDVYAREIKAEMTLKDEGSSGDGWDIVLHGVHYPVHGTIILTSTSPK